MLAHLFQLHSYHLLTLSLVLLNSNPFFVNGTVCFPSVGMAKTSVTFTGINLYKM